VTAWRGSAFPLPYAPTLERLAWLVRARTPSGLPQLGLRRPPRRL